MNRSNNGDILLESYDYHLPPELIAQEPLGERDRSRLMLIERETGKREHRYFYELPGILKEGDLLVFNDSRVIPARLKGRREDTGGKVEILLLRHLENVEEGKEKWLAMTRPGRRARPGQRIKVGNGVTGRVESIWDKEGYREFLFESPRPLQEILPHIGSMPVPPYIRKKLQEPESYQTVFAYREGSVAAPTAGLHFTPRLLDRLSRKGIEQAYITLHVGPGTFLPVKSGDITQHRMHEEYYEISAGVAGCINRAREEGRRIIAVGTTCCRVLESVADEKGMVREGKGWTDLFIYPGYSFKIINGLITNFHLPRSSLLMLVSAFAGRERLLEAYREAVEKNYRFYSFGDAMFIG